MTLGKIHAGNRSEEAASTCCMRDDAGYASMHLVQAGWFQVPADRHAHMCFCIALQQKLNA